MMRFLRALPLLGLGLLAACDGDDSKTINVPMNADGYALFSVDNDNQQRDELSVFLDNVAPGTTYVLLYSPDQPTDSGWFQLDMTTVATCGNGQVACTIPGYGDLVDAVTVPDNTTSIVLHDEQCGCGDDTDRDWTGHWAVMRVEQTPTAPSPIIHFHVVTDDADNDDSYTSTPTIKQLQ